MTAVLYSLDSFRERSFGTRPISRELVADDLTASVALDHPKDHFVIGKNPLEQLPRSNQSSSHSGQVRIDSNRLYESATDPDSQTASETEKLIRTCGSVLAYLKQAKHALDEDDQILADLCFMEAKIAARSLLDSIYVSDGAGLIISAAARTLSSINNIQESSSAITEMIRVLNDLKDKPNIAFSRAMELCEDLEQVADTPELALFEEIRTMVLTAFEKDDIHQEQ
jgi:hypothetical protein